MMFMVLGSIVAMLWLLWSPHQGFAIAFASLLERPVGSRGTAQFLMGKENAGGEYRGHPVLLVLHHKRGRNGIGYLVVAMKAADGFALKPGVSFREHVLDPDARSAWDTLELDEELKLSFEAGWMKATWQPSGFVMFPGKFDPVRWKRVLDAMERVVKTLK